MQPGEILTPGPSPTPEQPLPPEVPTVAPESQQTPQTSAAPPADQWQFSQEDTDNTQQETPAAPVEAISWTASEYVAHSKSTAWYAALAIGMLLIAAISYLLTKDILTVVAIAVAGLSLGVFAGRTPHVLEYALDSQGIHIGQKLYPYAEFKSFDVTEEGSLPAIQLLPLKRFMPSITLFYDEAQENDIFDIIGAYLPHQEQAPGMVDGITKRIRF